MFSRPHTGGHLYYISNNHNIMIMKYFTYNKINRKGKLKSANYQRFRAMIPANSDYAVTNQITVTTTHQQ